MSYLYFLFYVGLNAVDENGNKFNYLLDGLDNLLSMVLKHRYEWKFTEKNIFLIVKDVQVGTTEIKDVEINERDFDKIKKIILKQNLVKYSEEILDVELEKIIKEAEEFVSNRSDSATMEESITSYHVATGISYENISNLTIYQFNKGLERLNLLKTWEVYTYPCLKSGEADKVKHWLSHIAEKGIYDHITMNADEFQKMTSDSGIFAK